MHSTLPAVAVPALAAAAAFAAGMALVRPAGGASPDGDRVELELAGVLAAPDGGSGIVVLREKGAARILPVLVPGSAGRALRSRLEGRPAASPPLLDQALEALGARVVEVEIRRPHDGTPSTRVRLSQRNRSFDLDARPGESFGLAFGARAPIFVRRRVLDEDGLSADDVAKLRAEGSEPEDVRL